MCLRRAPEKYIAGAKAGQGWSRHCGIHISQRYRPPRPVTGILSYFTFFTQCMTYGKERDLYCLPRPVYLWIQNLSWISCRCFNRQQQSVYGLGAFRKVILIFQTTHRRGTATRIRGLNLMRFEIILIYTSIYIDQNEKLERKNSVLHNLPTRKPLSVGNCSR
jgi:hypothetical protein